MLPQADLDRRVSGSQPRSSGWELMLTFACP
jgi:hypothetical protein